MATGSVNKVYEPCTDYKDMAVHWKLPEALMGGTIAMRAAGRKYLPQYPAEDDVSYQDRLDTSTLFNAFRKTIKSLSAQPFKEPVKVERNNVAELDVLVDDVDLTGRDLTGFTRDMLKDMLTFGKCHWIVDFPDVRDLLAERGGRSLTLRQERELKLRPYFTRVKPTDLIGWRGGRRGGVDVLSRCRIKETIIEPNGEWGETLVQQIRVYYPDHIDLWRERRTEQGMQWAIYDSIPNPLGRIPLVTVYGNRTGFLTSLPPLEDLADMNVKHWQSQSDQDNILHFARIYFLAFMGFSEDEVEVVEVGQARGIANDNPEAHIDVVEHSGASIKAGDEDLERKERLMEGMGAEMLMPRPGNELATARAIDHAESVSDLQAYCRNLETGLEEGYKYAGLWLNKMWESILAQCDIYQGFGMDLLGQRTLPELREDFKLGAITHRTYLEERKRNGLYSDDFDVEEEIAALETEDPFLLPAVVTGAEDEKGTIEEEAGAAATDESMAAG